MDSPPDAHDARLQRRIQRYGWDLAMAQYEATWREALAPVHARLVACARLSAGERVLDVACGTGIVSFEAARAVGVQGHVHGIDLSGRMVSCAVRRADLRRVRHATFTRADAESLPVADAGFDVATCALGLMYVHDPVRALAAMRRALRPGGRLAVAVWGERRRCGWSEAFPIVDAEVESEVCNRFFGLGDAGALRRAVEAAGFVEFSEERLRAPLPFPTAAKACLAVFEGGPAALAWSRFDDETRARVSRRYLDAIASWRTGRGYRIPGEFVVATATVPAGQPRFSLLKGLA